MTLDPLAGSVGRFVRATVPHHLIGTLDVLAEAAAVGSTSWVRLDSEHVDAQIAEKVERAVQLRLVEHGTAQHRSRRHVFLLDPGEAFAEAIIQSSLDPDAESPRVQVAVLVFVLPVVEYLGRRGGPSPPFR